MNWYAKEPPHKARSNSGTKKPDHTSVQSGPSNDCSFGGESISNATYAAADYVPILTTLQLV